MTDVRTIRSGELAARVACRGGVIVDAHVAGKPFLRPFEGDETRPPDPLKAASFPFLPFGNRVEGNRFAFRGRDYALRGNTAWDPLYLHGDAWLEEWSVVAGTPQSITLAIDHPRGAQSPYSFAGWQTVSVDAGRLSLALAVTNTGRATLPFGLGHHCFFPLTPKTTLKASAAGYWTEKSGFLPDACKAPPADLDFGHARALPRRWLNNGFEGWTGIAEITWPERSLAVRLDARSPFSRYFLFHSDPSFEPGFADDYFCFEPMTHSANGQNLPDLGGLCPLEPGETLGANLTITPMVLA